MDIYLDVYFSIFPESDSKPIKEFPINLARDLPILVHPFGGWKAKEWNLNKFIDLVYFLSKNLKVKLIFQENQIPEDIIEFLQQCNIEYIESRSLEDLIREIKSCSVFIGNDSGPLNIASFLGKPTFTDDSLYDKRIPGVVLGLAWTSMGGTTLYIEATKIASKMKGFTQTGQQGNVMRESSEIAYTYIS